MKHQYTQQMVLLVLSVMMFQWGFSQNQIVGGDNVEEGKYPFMVGLIEANEPNLIKAIECGATVVGDRWILTAAHCLTSYDDQGNISLDIDPEEIEVLTGTYNLKNPVNGYRRLKVEKVFINPDYKRVPFQLPDGSLGSIPDNDIALIKLQDNLLIPPVRLPEVKDDSWEIDGLPVRVMGWGMHSTQSYTRSPSLREASIELIDRDVCKQYDLYDELVSTSMICAGLNDPGQSPTGGARGDSGGPLVFQTGDGWLQLGIMSWGMAYTDYQRPGVYQRVNTHLDWIHETMQTTGTRSIRLEKGIDLVRHGDRFTLSSSLNLGVSKFVVYDLDGRAIASYNLNISNGFQREFELPTQVNAFVFFIQSEGYYYSVVR